MTSLGSVMTIVSHLDIRLKVNGVGKPSKKRAHLVPSLPLLSWDVHGWDNRQHMTGRKTPVRMWGVPPAGYSGTERVVESLAVALSSFWGRGVDLHGRHEPVAGPCRFYHPQEGNADSPT